MTFHAQNLNDDRRGNPKGSMFWHGRCWLESWRAEWHMLSGRLSFQIGLDDEGALLTLGMIVATLYIGTSRFSMRNDREGGFYFSDGGIWVTLWRDPMSSSCADPWWKQMHVWRPLDTLLGRHKRSAVEIESRDVLIPLPEGAYPATVKIERVTFKRPRWFGKSYLSADVQIPSGLPVMGKGENSWDCGEDATYGLYTTAGTVEEAIGKTVAKTLNSRRRHGTPERLAAHMSPAVIAA